LLVLPGPGVEMSQYGHQSAGAGRRDRVTLDSDLRRNRKKDVYAGFGIASYWIVAPSQDKPTLTAFELRRGPWPGSPPPPRRRPGQG